MILVNNQGSGAHAFYGMSHSDWNGWTPADLVFPTFLFVVGASMAISMARSRPPLVKVARRAGLLFGIGLVMNALPPTVIGEVRIMGVLQRIGLAYLLASLAVVYLSPRSQRIAAAVVLLGYWALVAFGPMTPLHSIPGTIDRFLLGPDHVYKNGFYDPEGLSSTLNAAVSVLFGFWAVDWMRRQEPTSAVSRRLAGVGVALVAAGQLWHFAFPVNKRLWTSSFVVLTAGFGLLFLAACHEALEVRGGGRATRVMEILGRNALVIFIGSEILTTQLKAHGWRPMIYDHLLSPFLGFRLASLAYATAIAVVWWAVAYGMWRRRWFVKL